MKQLIFKTYISLENLLQIELAIHLPNRTMHFIRIMIIIVLHWMWYWKWTELESDEIEILENSKKRLSKLLKQFQNSEYMSSWALFIITSLDYKWSLFPRTFHVKYFITFHSVISADTSYAEHTTNRYLLLVIDFNQSKM